MGHQVAVGGLDRARQTAILAWGLDQGLLLLGQEDQTDQTEPREVHLRPVDCDVAESLAVGAGRRSYLVE